MEIHHEMELLDVDAALDSLITSELLKKRMDTVAIEVFGKGIVARCRNQSGNIIQQISNDSFLLKG